MKKQESGSRSLRQEKKLPTFHPISSRAKVRILYQKNKVFGYFSCHKGTMLDCAKAIGIERANVCRYVAELVNNGKVEKLYQGIDRHTKAKAYYYGVKGGEKC